jgi:hypothetical protein
MKNVLCVYANSEDFSHFLITVDDDHAMVRFAERWKASGRGLAYVDLGNDTSELIAMWNKAAKLPRIDLPAHVDHIVYASVY